MSEAKRGENHPFYGKHFSEEYRRKLSEAHVGKQRGELSANAKISEATAKQIKTALQTGIRICEICRKYNISRDIVKGIKSGKAWAWLKTA
jgi:DNA invertase Pin-like site-specific DNA recombinase